MSAHFSKRCGSDADKPVRATADAKLAVYLSAHGSYYLCHAGVKTLRQFPLPTPHISSALSRTPARGAPPLSPASAKNERHA